MTKRSSKDSSSNNFTEFGTWYEKPQHENIKEIEHPKPIEQNQTQNVPKK